MELINKIIYQNNNNWNGKKIAKTFKTVDIKFNGKIRDDSQSCHSRIYRLSIQQICTNGLCVLAVVHTNDKLANETIFAFSLFTLQCQQYRFFSFNFIFR